MDRPGLQAKGLAFLVVELGPDRETHDPCLPASGSGYQPGKGKVRLNPSYRIPKTQRWLRLAPPPPPESSRPAPVLDDEELIEAVVRKDIRRAGELHDRLISVIESTLYRLLGGRERDHDDLVQATFEQIVVTLMRGRFSRGCSLSTWASTVAAHVAFNSLRARRRARRVFDPTELGEVIDHGVGDAERTLGAREQIYAVQAHLGAMRPEQAMALVLHDVLGHELAEIATMLGITVAAAQSRLVRGRREFMRRLGKSEEALEEGP